MPVLWSRDRRIISSQSLVTQQGGGQLHYVCPLKEKKEGKERKRGRSTWIPSNKERMGDNSYSATVILCAWHCVWSHAHLNTSISSRVFHLNKYNISTLGPEFRLIFTVQRYSIVLKPSLIIDSPFRKDFKIPSQSESHVYCSRAKW